ncbi:hypothetical protein [Nonomuraea sp. NPDC049400]|uniref:hypothetical protein n=1 Tax=Nonomuraea sp. NPDC049400 TaxID=3364352 RepID=UPI0037A59A59
MYERFSHEVPKDVWAAREKLLEPGTKIAPKTAFRQIWAYTKDGYGRLPCGIYDGGAPSTFWP